MDGMFKCLMTVSTVRGWIAVSLNNRENTKVCVFYDFSAQVLLLPWPPKIPWKPDLALTFFLASAIFCFSASWFKLTFSLPTFSWLQKRFGGGLQTCCPVGIWKATALAFTAVNTCLDSYDLLLVELSSDRESSLVREHLLLAVFGLNLEFSWLVWDVFSFAFSFPF